MSEEFLDGANTCPEPQVLGIVAVLQKMGGEGVSASRGVRGDVFVDLCAAGGFLDRTLKSGGVEVVAVETPIPTPSLTLPQNGGGNAHSPDLLPKMGEGAPTPQTSPISTSPRPSPGRRGELYAGVK